MSCNGPWRKRNAPQKRCFPVPKLRLLPKNGFDPEFVDLVDEYDQIMSQHLTQDFVLHSDVGLRPNGITEFPFDHRKGRLDIAPLMVVLQEVLVFPHEVIEHVFPNLTVAGLATLRTVLLERDEWQCASVVDRSHI